MTTLVLFPVGTSTSGATARPCHSALLEPAVELGLAVRHAPTPELSHG